MRRHQHDTKTFEELNFKEQALAMNAAAAQYRKMLDANLRRAEADHRSVDGVRNIRLGLLSRIVRDYSNCTTTRHSFVAATGRTNPD